MKDFNRGDFSYPLLRDQVSINFSQPLSLSLILSSRTLLLETPWDAQIHDHDRGKKSRQLTRRNWKPDIRRHLEIAEQQSPTSAPEA